MSDQITLAVKYRPTTFEDVCGQESIRIILTNQLKNNTFKHSYLFTGPAGCGKTTCARIFANEINKGVGNPIEMDAASNSGVDDVRNITQQAKTQSLDSEYKVFIIDECHSISNTGWQAFLKLIEEPPLKSIFIFCTTNPEKIPKTILSRVQRYDFTRLPDNIIIDRLKYVCSKEQISIDDDALNFISFRADGGMRDGLTYLDKTISYNQFPITTDIVVSALGLISYDIMLNLLRSIIQKDISLIVNCIEDLYLQGYDLKLFLSDLTVFILEVIKYLYNIETRVISPNFAVKLQNLDVVKVKEVLSLLLQLNNDIKYQVNPHYYIEAFLINS